MKVLYVSDLDGTLLNGEEKLSLYSVEKINELISKGIDFTISTGRGDSVRKILSDINFKIPVMLLNGALSYDFVSKKYVNAKIIDKEVVIKIMKELKELNLETFEIRTLGESKLKRYDICNWDFEEKCLGIDIIDTKEKMEDISSKLKVIPGINFFIHKRVYAENEWFCNITPQNVSKASSLKEFKAKYNFDKIIAFGDSENDLPLAEGADEFYAVSNAAECVKQKATGIIKSNLENGVVDYIVDSHQ